MILCDVFVFIGHLVVAFILGWWGAKLHAKWKGRKVAPPSGRMLHPLPMGPHMKPEESAWLLPESCREEILKVVEARRPKVSLLLKRVYDGKTRAANERVQRW